MARHMLEEALQMYSAAGGIVFTKEADDPAAIGRVAESLELELPETFREFYANYEYISFGPDELLGIDQIEDAYKVLHSIHYPLPKSFLPFMADDAGGKYCVVCKESNKARCSEFGYVMYVPGSPPHEVEFKAADILRFLISRINFRMEDI